MTTQKEDRKAAFIKWIRRIGFWGFIFFLLKGLLWLALGYWVLK
ncbi:alanyl-tRNA synthetase [Chitinophaga tropicalis]|uniref:Alanyl-tRNA synthetase n=1 Tax=Chitinophaga tropicalis TaxID=2683588 RepID=A0A7K1U111_9BACT|nr:alanyl-tRNA synthetase [Chitinophaga tropicalis]MVT08038.1 alanyl-tRNA synthetase [Chitinophaga tropicalis]